MKQNKSWEDQLSAIYNDMTGSKVDFAREKEKARRRKDDEFTRSINRFSAAISGKPIGDDGTVVLLKNMPTNRDVPGYTVMTLCEITTAVVPLGFQPNPKRLDAPCEMCVNFQCPYAQGELDNDRVMAHSNGKMKVRNGSAVLVTSATYYK